MFKTVPSLLRDTSWLRYALSDHSDKVEALHRPELWVISSLVAFPYPDRTTRSLYSQWAPTGLLLTLSNPEAAPAVRDVRPATFLSLVFAIFIFISFWNKRE